MNRSVEAFVHHCQQSSNIAYEAFKQLLFRLEQPDSRKEAGDFLRALNAYYLSAKPQDCNFQFITQNILDSEDNNISLSLLQFPSTFLPEEWSFTFYEGLIRYPANEYQSKKIIELGCGIGWISIALALRYSPQNVTGLDINPKAIVCARLNLHLNSIDKQGQPVILENGRELLSVVHFYESNLFSHFESSGNNPSQLEVDRIIGCIPQVLNPEPKVMENLIAENASDEYLHSLSNYFVKQGYIEDQFGLGLIASAVEQSVPLLKSNGKLILNLGGRPGRSVLERLMQRRGFKVRRIWQTQVAQAADTEIDTLVDIEQTSGHRFEFYMSPDSETPIDASTALHLAKAGGKIFHSVDVYEAKMLFPQAVKSIYQSVDNIGGSALKSAIDLTYENYNDAEERYSFLAFLAKELQKISHFPYEDTAGLLYFRQQLAEYFRYYLRLNIEEKNLVITPGRRELITSLIANYQPELTLVAKPLAHLVNRVAGSTQGSILQAPASIEYLLELIERLKPQLVITRLDEHEVQSGQLAEQLIQTAIRHNTLLVIDLTDYINLSSQPETNGVYRYLSQHSMPDNLILMAGLMNNRVYQSYSLNITLCRNQQVIDNLVDAAELTYSRTPILKQYYYAHLLEELLYFQRTRKLSMSEPEEAHSQFPLTLSRSASHAFSHPSIKGNHLKFNQETVRLDFGENELASPAFFKETLLESYLIRKCSSSETSSESAVNKLLLRRFNISNRHYSKVVFGNGVAPIYAALLNICQQNKESLIIPAGSYGYFKAAAHYKGVDVQVLAESEAANFKISTQELRNCMRKSRGSWLFLNAPVVNPTGAIYTQQELSEIMAIALENECKVIMDCIFSGLEFNQAETIDLLDDVQNFSYSKNSKLVIIGGISKSLPPVVFDLVMRG